MLTSIKLKSSLNKCMFLFTVFTTVNTVNAKEGMWLPPTLKSHEADMKAMGLQIPVDKIYNEDGTGLNNAVVLFGRGCTGEIISSKGLVLTNHHCGYGSVQGLANAQSDYFANGFFAKNNQEEIPCPGLTVTFIRKMENVTGEILFDIPDTLNDASRETLITKRIKGLEKGYRLATGLDAVIKPYYDGNQYWVILSETYRDIRLVGFPPNGIGAFGGDAENWTWPRHTGDFSLFRVYAGTNNKPADFAKNNKPYETKNFLTINIAGYKEGDFTMVYGFPGTTQEYISSYQLKNISSISDPIRVQVRSKKLEVWDKNMTQSRDVFLKYTSKRAGVANGWKKWQGEMRGLQTNDVTGKKEAYEKDFQLWTLRDTSAPYAGNLLPQIQAATTAIDSILKADEYIREAIYGVELIQMGAALDRLLPVFRAGLPADKLQDSIKKLVTGMDAFYKNYDMATDKELFRTMLPLFFDKCAAWLPGYYQQQYSSYEHNFDTWTNDIYNISVATGSDKLKNAFASVLVTDSMRILSDPAWQLYSSMSAMRSKRIAAPLANYYDRMAYLNRLYMNSQMKKDKDKAFYPDANLTLRLTYGKVQGLDPEGPEGYSYQTNLDEVMTKNDPSVDEFHAPQKLQDLYKKKNYGQWAVKGTVPVAFIASNHTSGGNSGSPLLNAKGELIGTNFDRAWEGTMSDLYYAPDLCRNISLDIRYTLFIIDKFGDAGWLLKEMKITKK